MYKNFLKFFLIAVSVTLITNDMFAVTESKKVSYDTIDTRHNEENLGIPNDFIYKGKIISPHCIIERTSNVIDLEKCYQETYNNRDTDLTYDVSSDANTINTFMAGEMSAMADYNIKFIGNFAKRPLATANHYVHGALPSMNYVFLALELFYFKRDGDQLIIKPLNQTKNEWEHIPDAYIKNGVLYFSKLLTNPHTWSLMKKVAESQGNKDRFVRLNAENAWDFYKTCSVMMDIEYIHYDASKAFFQMHALDIMNAERDSASAPLFLPSMPYKIEFCYTCHGSFNEEDLTRRPIEIYEDKYCNVFPYIKVWLKYKKEGKQILKVDEFAAFVQEVNAMCESYKKKNNTK